VLKDASAAIYGARAANGAIIVQTKRGQIGKTTISFQTEYGIQARSSTYQAMDSYQRSQYNYEASTYAGVTPIFTQDEIQHFKKGDKPLRYPSTNWIDLNVDKAAPQSHHNISVQGGVENIQYFVSGDYRYQQGLWKSGDLNFR